MAEKGKKVNSVGALWKQTTKDGKKTYLAGNVEIKPLVDEGGEKVKLVVFANKFYDDQGNVIQKPADSKKPDFRIFISKPMKKEASEG